MTAPEPMPLSEPMAATLRALRQQHAKDPADHLMVSPASIRTAEALVRRGFAEADAERDGLYRITDCGLLVLGAYERIHGEAA